jgi:predicted glycosyltransferase
LLIATNKIEQKLLIRVNKIGFLRLNRVGLPQVEACCGGQLPGEVQQVGRRVEEGEVGVTAGGGDQGRAIVNDSAQVAVVQSFSQPLD